MINNFATLLKRLEAATSRLEDIALSVPGVEPSTDTPEHDDATPLPVSTPANAPPLPSTVLEFHELVNDQLAKYVDSGKGLDPTIAEQTSTLATAFKAQEKFLLVATKAKKPDMSSPAFAELLSGLQHAIGAVNDIKDSNRGSPYKDHLAMVSDGTGALSWIFETKPADYIGDVLGGIQMYGNRILKQHKESGPEHVAYVQAYVALWKGLQEYTKKNHPKGVSWNSTGVDLSEALKASDETPVANGTPAPPPPPAPGAAGGPPPPPPPPPMPVFDNAPPAPKAAASGGDMGAIFDQLNRGESVTSGLKKVDKSQMTHKNPTLRATGPVPERQLSSDSLKSKAPGTKPKPEAMRSKSGAAKKEGRKELDGNKWFIENYDSPSAPIEIEVTISHSILISRCKNTTIILKGKANAVSLDNCSRTNLVLDNLISSVDVVKCPNFALQVTGSLPTVMLDQVDGASLYLSNESLHTEVYTSKCSSINVVLPPKTEDDDSVECPVAEQIRTFIKDGKLVSEIVEHSG